MTYHNFALPKVETKQKGNEYNTSICFSDIIINTLKEFKKTLKIFFSKKQIWVALLFMLLFRFPEAQLVKIAQPFMLNPFEEGGLGLAKETVGFAYGTIGVIGLLLGGILGGLAVAKDGLKKWIIYDVSYLFARGENSTSVYALCTAFMALGMMLPGMVAGKLSDLMGYKMFFIWILIATIVTFVVTSLLKIDPNFGKKEDKLK